MPALPLYTPAVRGFRYRPHNAAQAKKNTQNLTVLGVSYGAADQIRTGDLILTKDALYRLSYSSEFGDPERARTVDL